MRWVYVSTAYHDHAKNVAKALHQDHRLVKWLIPIMYSGETVEGFPRLTKFLRHRVIHGLPESHIQRYLRWEFLRLAVFKLKFSPVLLDTVWEKGEFSIDRRALQYLERPDVDGVLGFEHGCLFSIRRARQLGKRCGVIFASVHHSMREKWVDKLYSEHSEWADDSEKILLKRAIIRDKRRDEEAELADFIYTNSEVSKISLVQGGFDEKKIIAIPLGMGAQQKDFTSTSSEFLRVIYVGSVALHKGFHVLQKAFLEIASDKIRLDVFGHIRVAPEMLSRSDRITFHGAVTRSRLSKAYSEADLLVFPSFSDGFGQAAAEALGYGIPIIVSENAGVCFFIKNGENGFRVQPGDSTAIKQSLQRCLEDRALLEKMKFTAFETAKSWTWADFRREWIKGFPLALSFEKKNG
jgi:glycosyltransferase involved in cell wall biosynthesis